MATGAIEPVIRQNVSIAKPSNENVNVVNQVSAMQSINKKADPKIVHRAFNSYKANNNTTNGRYLSESERVDYFNKQMYRYLDGIYTLIDKDMIEDAEKALNDYLKDIYITDDKPIIVEFYRLVRFVQEQLASPNAKQNKNRLMSIIGNLRDGFADVEK